MTAGKATIVASLTLGDALVEVILHTLALVSRIAQLPERHRPVAGGATAGRVASLATVVTGCTGCVLTVVVVAL